MECRDHKKGPQDDRWIEQLITKREKIGAWKTIAVSSSGFSGSAVATSAAYGIELRRFDEISNQEIAELWAAEAADFQMHVIVSDWKVLSVGFLDSNGKVLLESDVAPHVTEGLRRDLLDTEFLRSESEDFAVTVRDIANQARPPDGLIENGPPMRVAVHYNSYGRTTGMLMGLSGNSSFRRSTWRSNFDCKEYELRLVPFSSTARWNAPLWKG